MKKFKGFIIYHRLFFTLLALFFVVGAIDILNIDRVSYSFICKLAAPISGSPCPAYYDIPIWNVYLSLAILAALYHVHGEIRTSNKHLANHNK